MAKRKPSPNKVRSRRDGLVVMECGQKFRWWCRMCDGHSLPWRESSVLVDAETVVREWSQHLASRQHLRSRERAGQTKEISTT